MPAKPIIPTLPPSLLEYLEDEYVLAGKGYDYAVNRKSVRVTRTKPVIDVNLVCAA